MEPYKAVFLGPDGKTERIFVFCGGEQNAQPYFSNNEWNQLDANKIPVICSPLEIHKDDSIHIVKLKILNTVQELAYEELYMYGMVEKEFHSLPFYRNLTDNETRPLTKSLLSQALANYSNIEDVLSYVVHSDTFDYTELTSIAWFQETKKRRKVPLGYRFFTEQSQVDESFLVEPFRIHANVLNKNRHRLLENEFLFHYGELEDNTIYIVRAEEVLHTGMMTTYFPLLKNVKSLEDLLQERNKLLPETRKRCSNELLLKSYTSIALLNKLYREQPKLPYIEQGVQQFHFIMHPSFKAQKMPLDSLFMNIHASIDVPFIQFNPGLRQENTYRVFFQERAKNTKAIPYLSKSIVLELLKKSGREKNITLYLFPNQQMIEMSFRANGDIHVQGTCVPMLPKELNLWLAQRFEPVWLMVNTFLQQSGYYIRNFAALSDASVEIVRLNYIWKLPKQTVNIKKYMGCFSDIFHPDLTEKKAGIQMWYKRVENFQKMSEEDEFIATLLNNREDKEGIRGLLKEKFPLSNPDMLMKEYSKNHLGFLLPGRYVNRKIELMENPGFVTTFQTNRECVIEMQNINLYEYLEVIPAYIDSILRINSNPDILPEKDLALCTSQKNITKAETQMQLPELPRQEVFEELEEEAEVLAEYDAEDYGFDLLEDQEGGGRNDDDTEAAYRARRIEERDPILFRNMKGFARTNQGENPFLVTEEELAEIDPKLFETSIKYRNDASGKPLNYICPRYWCTKEGMEGPISETDYNAGVCGKKITDRIRPGEHVIEASGMFNHPGFVNSKEKKHLDDGTPICVPKCFQKVGPAQEIQRNICAPDHYKLPGKQKKENKIPTDEYILDPNTPLTPGRLARLPIPIQSFLTTDNDACIENRRIKRNCPVLLRYGVEGTQGRQSFLACLADFHGFEKGMTAGMPVRSFRELLIKSLTVDLYIQLHNGSLATTFQPAKPQTVDIGPYRTSTLFQRIDPSDDSQMSFFQYAVQSYENFIRFLRDEKLVIDHQFLWEIASRPSILFSTGLNLCILELPEHDNTNNVLLLCPPNPYTYPVYSPERNTVIMIKRGNVYEPIYRYERTVDAKKQEQEMVIKAFKWESSIPGLTTVMNAIKKVLETKCTPKNLFTIQHNWPAMRIAERLKNTSLTIVKAVHNYQGKTIAFLVDWKDKPNEVISKGPFYLPTFPSASPIDWVWMDDQTIWTDYYSTVSFLKHVHSLGIPCEPFFRVVDKEKVVGIITKTNQFVQLDKPFDDHHISDGLKTMNSSNYIMVDKTLQTKGEDVPDQKFHAIFLESRFYVVFRSTVRILLNLYKNRSVYNEILAIHRQKGYREKRRKVVEILRQLIGPYIAFHTYSDEVLSSLNEIYDCQDCQNKEYCLYKENSCQLLIPVRHLVTGESNEKIYLGRLADELLRHKRIHLFMFYPDAFFNMTTKEFQMRDDEVLITQSEFKNKYFDDLEAFEYKDYARNSSYETGLVDSIIPEYEWGV